jgi:hypothetical protein
MKIKCDCGDVLPYGDDFFDDAHAFWKKHGHFPGRVEFWCACGELHISGPEAGFPASEACTRDLTWFLEHYGHRAN